MKKFIFTLLIAGTALQLSAGGFYNQLCRFNPNWEKYALRAPEGDARYFVSDREYIQAHLESVLGILRGNPVAGLSDAQLQSRMHLISVLDGYRAAGRFPQNYYRLERIPVFIDEHHTHCAVGYLMQQTGYEELAQRIAATDNYVWVKDLRDPEALAWQAQSGFTLEELKLIQGAYDSYIDFAWLLPNRYEVPQKPEANVRYFDDPNTGKPMPAKPENVWYKGEGVNGKLNGKWIQNYEKGLPWIEGYYLNGQRSGQWKEYYQGTTQLCRTENWRNDKLNGVRKRYDRQGRLIEEIRFKDGKAVLKTNYSLEDSLTYVRKPLDSNLVYTEVFNYSGAMIASGHERIYNPSGLQWFQNIELTALNMMMLPSQSLTPSPFGGSSLSSGSNASVRSYDHVELYSMPALVEYHKEGDWMYYREYSYGKTLTHFHITSFFTQNYRHFARELNSALAPFQNMYRVYDYDSVRLSFEDNAMTDFYGYGASDEIHLHIEYYDSLVSPYIFILYPYAGNRFQPAKVIRSIGEYNRHHERIGEWKCYSQSGTMYKTENYLIPWKEEETTGGIQLVGRN